MTETHRHCQCDNCSGIDCGQDDPDRYLEQKIQDDERLENEIRKDERERILKSLRDSCVSRSWVDTDGDPHFGALMLEEIEEIIGGN